MLPNKNIYGRYSSSPINDLQPTSIQSVSSANPKHCSLGIKCWGVLFTRVKECWLGSELV